MPRTISRPYWLVRSSVITPIRPLRAPLRVRAEMLGWYPSRSATSRTRRRVPSAAPGFPLSTLDTVIAETPAASATCEMVTRSATAPPEALRLGCTLTIHVPGTELRHDLCG